MTCYICNKQHELAEHIVGKIICLDCNRKVQRAMKQLNLNQLIAVEVIKFFQNERNKQ